MQIAITPEQARERADATLRSLYATVTDWDRALIVQAIETIGADRPPLPAAVRPRAREAAPGPGRRGREAGGRPAVTAPAGMTGPERARAALGRPTDPARQVACPRCGAAPYVACTTPTGRRLTTSHPARTTARTQKEPS